MKAHLVAWDTNGWKNKLLHISTLQSMAAESLVAIGFLYAFICEGCLLWCGIAFFLEDAWSDPIGQAQQRLVGKQKVY